MVRGLTVNELSFDVIGSSPIHSIVPRGQVSPLGSGQREYSIMVNALYS